MKKKKKKKELLPYMKLKRKISKFKKNWKLIK